MAVINIDDYSDTGCFPFQQDYGLDSSGTSWYWNIYTTIICSHCQERITQCHDFTYCPYCGKELFPKPKPEEKAEIIKRLDAILKEVEEIKKELTR